MDVICAISTPLGESGIAVVRMSGEGCLEVADKVFKGKIKPSEAPSHTVHYGKIVDPETGEEIDEVLLTVMRAPRTYTREDMVEIGTHGGLAAPREVLKVLIKAGARQAEPGEFTRRALLNGRIDITKAEAILEIVKARTRKGLIEGVKKLGGEVTKKLKEIERKLEEIEMLLELDINFPEVSEVKVENVKDRMKKVLEEIRDLMREEERRSLYSDGVSVAITGRPNVGKSSLFNALLKKRRAIVTSYPGTTRDAIEDWIKIDGIPVKLIDTCGLRETEDPIEKEGVRQTLKVLRTADIVIYLCDAVEGEKEEDRKMMEMIKGKRIIKCMNKIDLKDREFDGLKVSAKEGRGINELLHSLKVEAEKVTSHTFTDDVLREGVRFLEEGLSEGYFELIAECVKETLKRVRILLGEEKRKDILDLIFRNFCIGK